MTVANNDRLKQLTATGGETTLPYDFTLANKTHLVVTEEDTANVITTLVVDVDYTVNGVGQIGGSTITLDPTLYPSGATAAHIFTLSGDTPAQRLNDFPLKGDLSSVKLNSEQDAVIEMLQQLERDIGFAYSLPLTDGENPITTVPSVTARASKFWAWDGSGNLVAAAGTSADLTPVSAFINTLLDDVDASTALSTLGFSAFIKTLVDDADAETARATLLAGPQLSAEIPTISGTAVGLTGIPAWAKHVKVMLDRVKSSGTSLPLLRLGPSGGIDLGIYGQSAAHGNDDAAAVNNASGFPLETVWPAADELTGVLTLTRMPPTSGNTWLIEGTIGSGAAALIDHVVSVVGLANLTGDLSQLSLTTVGGSDTFTQGSYAASWQ